VVNNIRVTLVHQSENFGIDRRVGVHPEVYFALAQGDFIEYNLKLQVNQHQEMKKKVEKQTAVVAMAMVTLGTSPANTSGNNLPTEEEPV
jgi:hypothetical protein